MGCESFPKPYEARQRILKLAKHEKNKQNISNNVTPFCVFLSVQTTISFLCVIFVVCSTLAATNREPCGEPLHQVGVNMTFKVSTCIGIQFLGFVF